MHATAPYPTEDAARAALLEAARATHALGLNHGSAGNLSVRWHRGGADGLLVTPSALPWDRCGPDDLVWMSIARDGGEPIVDGDRRPTSEWRLHHDLHAGRPDVRAVVHAHAPHAAALSCLPQVQRHGLPAFHYMVAAAGGADVRCAPYATFGTGALSDRAIAALDGRRACLLAHHGLVAVGADLDGALALAVELEWLSRTYLLALQAGGAARLPDDEMARVLERFADYRP
ncbi:MAG TPA: class II aldolase/adducin family protein [Burkholderiaceae bacterium]|nr:class II aldolase/adducin family protein [Burkholderiaceae bacterium]